MQAASTLEEESQLVKQAAKLETIVAETAIYSREAFNSLLEHPTIQEAIKKQYSTTRIQVFENFLALPPEQQPDAYKQQLLEQLYTWSAQELAAIRAPIEAQQPLEEEITRLAVMTDYFIEEQQAQELAAARADLKAYQQKHPVQQADETPVLNLNQQPAELNKTRFSWANVITLMSISLFIGGGIAAGLFFIGLPLWIILTAGIGSFILGTLAVAGYAYSRSSYLKPASDTNQISAKLPNFYYASIPASNAVSPSTYNTVFSQQTSMTAAPNNNSTAAQLSL